MTRRHSFFRPQGVIPLLLTAALSFSFVCAQDPEAPKPARILMDYWQMGATYDWFKLRETYYHHLYYGRLDGQEIVCGFNLQHLEEYSSLILCPGLSSHREPAKPLDKVDPESFLRLMEFVQSGGNLVVVGAAIHHFNSPEMLNHLGVKSLLSGMQIARSPYVPVIEDHPLFRHFKAAKDEEEKSISLEDEEGETREAMPEIMLTALVAEPGDSVVLLKPILESKKVGALERTLGKGKIVVLPQELFPPFAYQARTVSEKNLDPQARQFLENLFPYLNVPKLEEAIPALMQKGPFARSKLTVWLRQPDHQIFQGAQMLSPPVPTKHSEALSTVRRIVGIHEHERIPLYVTVQGAAEPLAVLLVQRTPPPPAPDLFSAASLRIQGPPAEDLAGPTVYLSAPQRRNGRLYFPTRPSDTLTLWLQFDTTSAVPGSYDGEIQLSCSGEEARVQVALEVRDVRLPEYHLHHFEAETNALAQFVGNDPAKIRVAVEDLASAHVDHIMVSPTFYQDAIVRETSLPLSQFLVPENRARFEKGEWPSLDLSHAGDWYFHEAIKHGLVIHRSYYYINAERYLPQLAIMLGQPELSAQSPHFLAFARWYLAETLAYLREKGFRFTYLKFGDEWLEDELPEFLDNLRPAKEAGWSIVANPNGWQVLGVSEHREKLMQALDIFQECAGPENYVRCVEEVRKRREVIPPDGLWMVTTSSWWWNKLITSGWQHGYTMAYNGVRNLHYHGWTRGGNHGVYLDDRQGRFIVRPSVGYLHLGEGIEEAEVLTMARKLIRYARQQGLETATIEARLAKIVGPGDAIVPMDSAKEERPASLLSYLPHPASTVGVADYRRAKEALLLLVMDLRKAIGPVKRELRWGYFRLYEDKRGLRVACGPGLDEAAQALLAGLTTRSEGTATMDLVSDMARIPEFPGVTIMVVQTADEPMRQQLLRAHPRLTLSADYPRRGSYSIYGPLKNGSGDLVVIAGGGPDGARLGCENFVQFIEDVYGEE